MSVLLTPSPSIPTVGKLLERLGNIPAERVRYYPLPGTATEQDVIEVARQSHLCELIDGVLVEKPMGLMESHLASVLIAALCGFVDLHKLGIVTGEAGMMRLSAGMVRIPDVAFLSWSRLPGGKIPSEPIPTVVPDLAIEILSQSNTRKEMERKLADYFGAGVRIVWIVDPQARTVTVHNSPQHFSILNEDRRLDGEDVLPGFVMELKSLFARLT